MTARTGGPATLLAILPRSPPIWRSTRVRVVFHPGWIPDKFADVDEKKFCFVHIDVDLYEPTRASLAFFGERLTPGGILICDDYGFETCPGARLAMDEYAGAVRKPVVHLPTGQGIIF